MPNYFTDVSYIDYDDKTRLSSVHIIHLIFNINNKQTGFLGARAPLGIAGEKKEKGKEQAGAELCQAQTSFK